MKKYNDGMDSTEYTPVHENWNAPSQIDSDTQEETEAKRRDSFDDFAVLPLVVLRELKDYAEWLSRKR